MFLVIVSVGVGNQNAERWTYIITASAARLLSFNPSALDDFQHQMLNRRFFDPM